MSKTNTDKKCVKSRTQRAHRQWDIDPLGNKIGRRMTVDQISIVRIASVAAETGARMQRDGLAVDPLQWMITPLSMFAGRPPIEACMNADACARAFLLHGLGLDLDANLELLEALLAEAELDAEEVCD